MTTNTLSLREKVVADGLLDQEFREEQAGRQVLMGPIMPGIFRELGSVKLSLSGAEVQQNLVNDHFVPAKLLPGGKTGCKIWLRVDTSYQLTGVPGYRTGGSLASISTEYSARPVDAEDPPATDEPAKNSTHYLVAIVRPPQSEEEAKVAFNGLFVEQRLLGPIFYSPLGL